MGAHNYLPPLLLPESPCTAGIMHERVFVFLQKLTSSCLPRGASLRPGSRAVGQAPGPLLCPLSWRTPAPQTPLDPGRKADGTLLGALSPELQRPIPALPACVHFLLTGSSRLHLPLCESVHILTFVCVFTCPRPPSLAFGGPVFTQHGGDPAGKAQAWLTLDGAQHRHPPLSFPLPIPPPS